MKRFLVIKPSSLGDVLHAFPAVSALAAARGEEWEAHWLVQPAFAQLLDYLPFVKKKILFERKRMGNLFTFLPSFLRLFAALREGGYDAVYDLQGLLRSALFSFLTGSSLRWGPREPREKAASFFYTDRMSAPEGARHAVDKLCGMIAEAEKIPLPERTFTLPVLEKYRKSALKKAEEEGLSLAGRKEKDGLLVSVTPGARWKSKTWEPEFFASLVRGIHEKFPHAHFLLLGSEAEKEAAGKVLELLGKDIPCTDLVGKTTMGELVELIRLTDLLLCNDSGPMHIAAVTGTVPVAFFGPTDPALTGPCCKRALVFQREDLSCIKCFRKKCGHLDCHKGIRTEKVLEEILKLFPAEKTDNDPEKEETR